MSHLPVVDPSVIQVDSRPQFWCQEFLEFCKKNIIKLETSSPYNQWSNGLAGAAVKNRKRLVLRCIDGGGLH